MGLFACPKCGESYHAFPPNSTHKKSSRYPDRNTIPTTLKCEMCGTINRIYWKKPDQYEKSYPK